MAKSKVASGQLSLDLITDTNALPTPVYIRDRKKLIKLYDTALKELGKVLLKELAISGSNSVGVVNTAKVMKQVELILSELNNKAKPLTAEVIKQSIQHGQAVHLMQIADIKNYDEALRQVGLTQLNTQLIDAMASDTFADMLVATQHMGDSLKLTIRKTISKIIQVKTAQNTGRVEMEKALLKELTKKGLSKTITKEAFVGIIDKAGRRWNLKTYIEMVVITKTQQAHVEGIKYNAMLTGYDLAIVSHHGAKDACRHYENMIISVNGNTKGYPTYEALRATGDIFHPSCQHTLMPIRTPELVHPDILAEHRQKLAKYQKN